MFDGTVSEIIFDKRERRKKSNEFVFKKKREK